MFTLTTKKTLTHDVYELTFESDATLEVQAWQFFMFVLPSWLRRAYSVASSDGKTHIFIIKRLTDGRWGSKEIADLEVGAKIENLPPMGHFLLQKNDQSKLFLGTGTGFAPLYHQIVTALSSWFSEKITFVFWIRTWEDVFYLTELEGLKKNYANFDFSIYLSREKILGFENGYVTDFLTQEHTRQFQEFYICGSPVMVAETRLKLENLGIDKANIYFEQY